MAIALIVAVPIVGCGVCMMIIRYRVAMIAIYVQVLSAKNKKILSHCQ